MYKKQLNTQFNFSDFNQPIGLRMNNENRWVKKAEKIPWDDIEDKYAALFESNTGTVAKPLRMALGSLIIQTEYGYSDRELVAQIQENPYYQFFIGLPGYQEEAPYVPSLLVEFRKRLTPEILGDINEMIIRSKDNKNNHGGDTGQPDISGNDNATPENRGTMLIDATCAPQNISFPQDTHLLNECREKLEGIIDYICETNSLDKPRTYRREARKEFLKIARNRRKTAVKIRKAIKKQLQYIRRDLAYIDEYLAKGYTLKVKQERLLGVLRTLYSQQKTMYEEKSHSVPDRIVSISQPHIRPIVRGKASAAVEFGAKLDISVVDGFARIERLSFDAYNESEVLQQAVNNYREKYGCYPQKILADKIYRNRDNLNFCKQHNIRISGPALGRPKKDVEVDRKEEYRDNCDRVEVERAFSLAKRNYGLGLIRTRLEETSKHAIALSILAMNLNKVSLRQFLYSVFRTLKAKILILIQCHVESKSKDYNLAISIATC